MARPATAACLALLAVLLALAPSARAGAVFETRENIPTNPADLKFMFGVGDGQLTTVPGAGNIRRSGGAGAGLFFKPSALPLTIFNLEKCAAVAPHVHPNAGETLFMIAGRIRVYQFRGEEDGTAVRTFDLLPGQAGYIQQGAIHFAENVFAGKSQFLQIFDHPQGGTNFVGNALVNLRAASPKGLNSAFSTDVFGPTTAPIGPLYLVRNCTF